MFLGLVAWLVPAFVCGRESLLTDLAVTLEVWERPAQGAPKRFSKSTLFEGLHGLPKHTQWHVKVKRTPPAPLSHDDWNELMDLLSRIQAPGLSLANQQGIGDKEVESLGGIESLEWLDLQGTGVTDAGLKKLKRLVALKAIGIEKTPMSGVGVQNLERILNRRLMRIPLEQVLVQASPNVDPREKVTTTGVHYVDFGAAPGSRINGSIPRGKAWMDFEWQLTDIHGKTMRIRSKKGQVLFLNFWATWCGPCRSELPSIGTLARGLSSEGIFVACVSQESPQVVKAFSHEHPTDAPLYTTKAPPSGGVFSNGIPATYIVSPKGDIAVIAVGSRQWDTQEIIQYLLKLRDERP